jgi:hypothetical protein
MSAARELLEAAACGPQSLEAFLERHPLTPQLANEVREAFVGAAQAGRLEAAELAASVASLLWLRLGNTHETFRNAIDHLQVRFQMAQNSAGYLDVRTKTLDVLSRLRSVQEDEFSFRAAVLAADASYFGHRAGGANVGLTVPLMLADLASAMNYAERVPSSKWLPKFVELMAVAVQMAIAAEIPEDERDNVDRSLRRLARETGSIAPARRYFPEDPAKGSDIERLLAQLLERYRK